MANKWVYMFSEGDMTMRNLLGGKGANLCLLYTSAFGYAGELKTVGEGAQGLARQRTDDEELRVQ